MLMMGRELPSYCFMMATAVISHWKVFLMPPRNIVSSGNQDCCNGRRTKTKALLSPRIILARISITIVLLHLMRRLVNHNP